jgi:ATP-dependent Clp protease protease subunit
VSDSRSNEPPSRRQLSAWLQEKLFERRIVLITGQLNDAVAAEVSAQLVTLAATREEPIDIHVDSPDGTIAAAFVLIDTLRQRSAAPHTRFRLGQPKAQFSGTPDQIVSQNRQHQDLLWRLYARLAQVTGHPAEEIAEDMRRGRYFDAREVLHYGLIDEISATR